ncbi:MAG: hypothetical protein N6V49_14325, partial [Serratia symbiotica]|nr:hypothetical protein [Serratia symbiotica]
MMSHQTAPLPKAKVVSGDLPSTLSIDKASFLQAVLCLSLLGSFWLRSSARFHSDLWVSMPDNLADG